jgi:Na+/proline symporter
VFSTMSGVSLFWMIVITGLATTAYTVAGGVGAVVWTDVKQMVVIVVGIFACLVVLLWQTVGPLSLPGVFEALGAAGKMNAVEVTNPAWSLAPAAAGSGMKGSFWSDEYNVWTGLFGTLFLFLSYFGCDQSQVQSILTSKSVDASRRALLMSAFTKVPLQLLVLFLGGLLYLHHSLATEPLLFSPEHQKAAALLQGEAKQKFDTAAAAHATAAAERRAAMLELVGSDGDDGPALIRLQGAVVAAKKAREDARAAAKCEGDINYILPDFLFRELSKPVLGLMIAAIFAAAISSAAGALSSLTSATMIDFHRRWFAHSTDEQGAVRTSRIVMACWGIAATFAATLLGDGPLLEMVNKIGSCFYGSILGVFLLALFVPRANDRAAAAGLIGGLLSVLAVWLCWDVAFLWYNLVGCASCMAVGGLVLLVAPRR